MIGKYIYNYRITDSSVEVVLVGKIPIYKISLRDIDSVEEIGFKDTLTDFFAIRFGNRLLGPGLRISLSKGIVRKVLITPDNPEKFKMEIDAAKSKI